MIIEIVLLLITVFILIHYLRKPPNYPPGPWGIPLIGNIKGIETFLQRLHDLKEQHGDIFCWRLGTRVMVVLTDFNMIKEAFQSFQYIDRPELGILDILKLDGNYGVLACNGLQWQNSRRFTIRQMRDLGMGKSKLVSAIQFEASEMVTYMNQETGKSVLVTSLFVIPVINVIWEMVASTRYKFDDQKIIDFDQTLKTYELSASRQSMRVFFPWIDYVAPKFILDFMAQSHITSDVSSKFTAYIMEQVEEHIKELDPNSPGDFIDEYLIEIEKQKGDPSSTMSEKDMISCVADLFLAGSQTTAKTLQFCLLYLASFPKVQKKLQEEIDTIIPKGTSATLDDKSRLPYTEAFIHETLRYSTLAPTAVFHLSIEESKLAGYTIPKGAFMISFTESVHFNPKYFNNPHEFRPERFLDDQGKFFTPKEGFMPFGIGKRQCLGESLGRMETYIFLTTMVQNFTFEPPPGKVIDLSPLKSPIINMPKDQDIVFYSR